MNNMYIVKCLKCKRPLKSQTQVKICEPCMFEDEEVMSITSKDDVLYISEDKPIISFRLDQPQDEWEKEFARYNFEPIIHSKGRMYFKASQVKQFISSNFISKTHLESVIERLGDEHKEKTGEFGEYSDGLIDLKKELL